jgi:tubulin epsilon
VIVSVVISLLVVLSRSHQLLKVDPRRSTYLACGLLLRGDVVVSDVQRSIARIKKDIKLIHWNQDGFKVGLCSVPPVGQSFSLLGINNNCCFRFPLQ